MFLASFEIYSATTQVMEGAVMIIIVGASDLFLSWVLAQVECPLQYIIMLRRAYTSIGNFTY
jgi:hypothetical protein